MIRFFKMQKIHNTERLQADFAPSPPLASSAKRKRRRRFLTGDIRGNDFLQQGRKGYKEGVFVSDLCGLCGLVVKFVFVFAFLRRIPCVWLRLCRFVAFPCRDFLKVRHR
jgi:hypothetical protein